MRLNLVLEDPKYLLHRDVVRSVANGLEREVARALGARCLLRVASRARRAAAHGSPRFAEDMERILVALETHLTAEHCNEAARLQESLDDEIPSTLETPESAVLLTFLQAVVDFEACVREGREGEALGLAAWMPLDMLDMLEDDGELAPSSLVRQLADAEVARQCRDLEEAIDGRVVARDESVVELQPEP